MCSFLRYVACTFLRFMCCFTVSSNAHFWFIKMSGFKRRKKTSFLWRQVRHHSKSGCRFVNQNMYCWFLKKVLEEALFSVEETIGRKLQICTLSIKRKTMKMSEHKDVSVLHVVHVKNMKGISTNEKIGKSKNLRAFKKLRTRLHYLFIIKIKKGHGWKVRFSMKTLYLVWKRFWNLKIYQ